MHGFGRVGALSITLRMLVSSWLCGGAVALGLTLAACGGSPGQEVEIGAREGSVRELPAVFAIDDDPAFAGSSSGGDEANPGCVGPAECVAYAQHSPDCSYVPEVSAPRYDFCTGPVVWVDTTHENWHQITPESDSQPGRFWGFAELLFADGYDVNDSDTALDELVVGEGPDVLVIASAYRPDDEPEALTAEETQAVLDWVHGGGSLLLIFDHPPFDRVGDLLAALGLEQVPVGADTMATYTFRRPYGTLTAVEPLRSFVPRVSQFRGTSFDLLAATPADVAIAPIMTFPPAATALVDGEWVSIAGRLGAATVTYGEGRVYVSAEAAGFSAQTTGGGTQQVGMQVTRFNERFVLSVMHWLDRRPAPLSVTP